MNETPITEIVFSKKKAIFFLMSMILSFALFLYYVFVKRNIFEGGIQKSDIGILPFFLGYSRCAIFLFHALKIVSSNKPLIKLQDNYVIAFSETFYADSKKSFLSISNNNGIEKVYLENQKYKLDIPILFVYSTK
jgi:hypothetical protein